MLQEDVIRGACPPRMPQGRFRFRLGNDPVVIPAVVGLLRDWAVASAFCDANRGSLLATALSEALQNAIDHGNLELASELREREDDAYMRLAAERRRILPYRRRHVYLSAKFSAEQATFVVRDEGPGFDPRRVPDPCDPANLTQLGGRGLFLIRKFLDRVEFNDKGNVITMSLQRHDRFS